MIKKILAASMATALGFAAMAEEVQIAGTVESKCVVQVDTLGVYGNPTPSTLSTDNVDGGVTPIIRFDVVQSNYYKARITTPNSFSQSPALDDVVAWTGVVAIGEVSDTQMSAYTAAMITYDNVSEVDLSIAGSTWFDITSQMAYGYDKALPAGTYRAVITADCIAL
tara:strand:- start:874 stop:1374 length:501 start_codon:yes stop_codon:yes gene_type:complete